MFSRNAMGALLFLLIWTYPAHAQTVQASVSIVSCSPNVSLAKDGTFVAKEGEVVTFKCVLKNSGDVSAKVLLDGERTLDGGDTAATVRSSGVTSVPPRGTIKTNISFIPVFRDGTYRYVLTLKNLTEGKTFGSPVTFTSILNSPSIRIDSITFDKKAYTPGAPVSLSIVVSSPTFAEKATTTPFSLDVSAKGEDGKDCLNIRSSSPITQESQIIDFSLPVASSGCTIASISVIVKSEGGFPLDSRDVPLPGYTASTPFVLVLVFVVIFSLLAIVWIMRVLRRRTTPTLP